MVEEKQKQDELVRQKEVNEETKVRKHNCCDTVHVFINDFHVCSMFMPSVSYGVVQGEVPLVLMTIMR